MQPRTITPARHTVPMVLARVAAGFPSPAEDYLDTPLDFNELLLAHPAATFAVRVTGDSMVDTGIFPGDIAIVDRAVTATSGSVILAVLDGEFTIKTYRDVGSTRWLEPANTAYKRIPLSEASNFEVWGVVRRSIRMLAP